MDRKGTNELLKPYTHYIALGPWCWGRATTIKTAIRNMFANWDGTRKDWSNRVSIYLVTEDTEVGELGGLRFPRLNAPIELRYDRKAERYGEE